MTPNVKPLESTAPGRGPGHGHGGRGGLIPGGVKGGVVHGETDEFSYNIVRDPVHVRDLQATLLHLFGIDHQRFTYLYQGLDQRLTGVEPSKVVKEILA